MKCSVAAGQHRCRSLYQTPGTHKGQGTEKEIEDSTSMQSPKSRLGKALQDKESGQLQVTKIKGEKTSD